MNNLNVKSDTDFINQRRIIERQKNELIGICKGIMFDGMVCYDEARNLFNWLQANPHACSAWPGTQLQLFLSDMLKNNTLSTDDERKLLVFLHQIIGHIDPVNTSAGLPLTQPAPPVIFSGSVFVLTGHFSIGSRSEIVDLITKKGGEVVLKNVRKDTDYLVIGDVANGEWMYSTHGRKIEKAIELRDKGSKIALISEQHFNNAIHEMETLPIGVILEKLTNTAKPANAHPFFSAFMALLDEFEALEQKGIKTYLYENSVFLHHCFKNGKHQAMPSFSLERDDDNENSWGVYGLSTPLLFSKPQDALSELIRLANI